MRTSHVVLILLTAATFGMTQSPQKLKLSAPTYYIAADSDFKGLPSEMRIRGASNLPQGTRLGVDIYDYSGPRATRVNEDAVAVVGGDGFFEVILRPKQGIAFRHNLVCAILFMPAFPHQEPSVLEVLGKRGEHLGFPKNPQARVASGAYYLSEMIYVP